jgi:hypothetical protein
VVPKPAAFVVNKLITSQRRKDKWKQQKDRITAKEFGEYIIADHEQKDLLKEIFQNLSPKLKKSILNDLKEISRILMEELAS